MATINFTKSIIDNLTLPVKGWQYYTDIKTPGLSIGVGSTGIKTFVLYKRIDGKPERVKIGRYPDVSIEQARRKATEFNGQIAQGQNPADNKRISRAEMTLSELFKFYMERYAIPHNLKSIPAMQAMFDNYLGKIDAPRKKHGRERVKPVGAVDWSGKKISTITTRDVFKLHHDLGTATGKTIANRVVELLRAMFNRCQIMKIVDLPNPAEGIQPYKEVTRDRFLQGDEFKKYYEALENESEQNRDFFMLALLTGARKTNVLSMKWQDVNIEQEVWRVPGEISKNGQPMLIPLTLQALVILKRRKETSASDYVFAGEGQLGHMTSPKRAWKRIIKSAGLTDIRPHDLRRSLGSWMVNTGASIAMIGGALGHKDAKSTEVYARLAMNPIKAAMETAQDAMLGYVKLDKPIEIKSE
jgi:integrase